jgi:hypothetical protein
MGSSGRTKSAYRDPDDRKSVLHGQLIHNLEQMEEVISLSVVREASIKPRGYVLTVHALNLAASKTFAGSPTPRASRGRFWSGRPS